MEIEELKKLKGDPTCFLKEKAGIGFADYTFEEACRVSGFKRAFENAWGYYTAIKEIHRNGRLVKDFLSIFGDGFRFEVKGTKERFCTDMDGVILNGPHKGIHFRDFEIQNPGKKVTYRKTVLQCEKI